MSALGEPGDDRAVSARGRQTARRWRRLAARLPAERPAHVPEREWALLLAYLREGATGPALAGRTGLSRSRIQVLLREAARKALDTGELAALPAPLRRHLERAGYRTRAAIAAAPDADLLAVRELGPAKLRRLRALIPHRGGDA